MIDYNPLYQVLENAGASSWAEQLSEQAEAFLGQQSHGDWLRWQAVVDALPTVVSSSVDLIGAVRIGEAQELSAEVWQKMYEGLQKLHPWRKGPYQLFGINIDTEWRSDWKWERLKTHVSPLKNRLVLDVGCGNGYYGWRMLGAGARMVVGIDPTILNVMQFQAVRKLYGEAALYVLPLGIEQVPANLKIFDTVFSMGVLYHRRSPIDHLLELKGCLRPGGELVLETIVIDGSVDTVLVPEQRYAQMRNVWFLPSCEALIMWMRRCGFKDIKICHVGKTTINEQRSTEWMRFKSLRDFLDPDDDGLTCEGLPAPLRAIVTANID